MIYSVIILIMVHMRCQLVIVRLKSGLLWTLQPQPPACSTVISKVFRLPFMTFWTGGSHYFILIFFIYYQDDTVGGFNMKYIAGGLNGQSTCGEKLSVLIFKVREEIHTLCHCQNMPGKLTRISSSQVFGVLESFIWGRLKWAMHRIIENNLLYDVVI